MTWVEELLRLVTGEESASGRRVDAELLAFYEGFLERSRQLGKCAEMAPTEQAEDDLRRLAADHYGLARELARALEERAVTIPAGAAPGSPPLGGQSHWARLVAEMEEQRAARDQLREAAVRIGDGDLRLGSLLESLWRRLEGHLARLRSMIARADPQALD